MRVGLHVCVSECVSMCACVCPRLRAFACALAHAESLARDFRLDEKERRDDEGESRKLRRNPEDFFTLFMLLS